MQSCELVATITAIACAIAKCCPEEELPILAASFTQLGDTLATIIVQEERTTSKLPTIIDRGNGQQNYP
jgi:hypothetical protein